MRFSVFETGSKLVPAFSKPYQNEVLGSWLTRISYGHGITRSSLLKLVGVSNERGGDWEIDRLFSDEQINILAQATNTSKTEIGASMVKSYENTLFEGSAITAYGHSLWRVRSNRSRLQKTCQYNSGTLYCPSCFSKSKKPIYYKREWQVIVSFVCLDCKCYLRERCPHCKNGPSTMNTIGDTDFRKSIDEYLLTCKTCDKNISDCDPVPAPDRIINLQAKINGYLHGTQNEVSTTDYFKLLYKISCLLLKRKDDNPFRRLIKQIYQLYDVVDLRSNAESMNLRRIPVRSQASVFYMADQLLKEWPEPLLGLANKYHIAESQIIGYFQDMPDWFKSSIQLSVKDTSRFKKSTPKTDPYYLDYQRIKIDCSTKIEYDYNWDDEYYGGNPLQDRESMFPRKTEHNATDILNYQMWKSKW